MKNEIGNPEKQGLQQKKPGDPKKLEKIRENAKKEIENYRLQNGEKKPFKVDNNNSSKIIGKIEQINQQRKIDHHIQEQMKWLTGPKHTTEVIYMFPGRYGQQQEKQIQQENTSPSQTNTPQTPQLVADPFDLGNARSASQLPPNTENIRETSASSSLSRRQELQPPTQDYSLRIPEGTHQHDPDLPPRVPYDTYPFFRPQTAPDDVNFLMESPIETSGSEYSDEEDPIHVSDYERVFYRGGDGSIIDPPKGKLIDLVSNSDEQNYTDAIKRQRQISAASQNPRKRLEVHGQENLRPYPGSQGTSSQIEASVSAATPIGIESIYDLSLVPIPKDPNLVDTTQPIHPRILHQPTPFTSPSTYQPFNAAMQEGNFINYTPRSNKQPPKQQETGSLSFIDSNPQRNRQQVRREIGKHIHNRKTQEQLKYQYSQLKKYNDTKHKKTKKNPLGSREKARHVQEPWKQQEVIINPDTQGRPQESDRNQRSAADILRRLQNNGSVAGWLPSDENAGQTMDRYIQIIGRFIFTSPLNTHTTRADNLQESLIALRHYTQRRGLPPRLRNTIHNDAEAMNTIRRIAELARDVIQDGQNRVLDMSEEIKEIQNAFSNLQE
jgi:hypothetical protein